MAGHVLAAPEGRAAEGTSSRRKEMVMKKGIAGFVALGVIIALRPLARRMGQKMREHCAQYNQMAAHVGSRGEAVGRA
jgi:hypothetical protein